jgi:hypothetical protein
MEVAVKITPNAQRMAQVSVLNMESPKIIGIF